MTSRIAIVGKGRVGGALARAFTSAGDTVAASIGRGDPIAGIAGADLVIIAVPDEALADVAAEVLSHADAGALVVHTCGSVGLEPLAGHGERIGVLHPAIPVASDTQPLEGAVFGISGTPASIPLVEAIVRRIGGRTLVIDDDERVRYHAALVHASNHLVALVADAESLLGDRGDALLPLVQATVENLAAAGAARALTGPVVRGDAATVAKHLAAIPGELRASYRENARRALALAIESGRLDPESAQRIASALDESPQG